MHRRRTGIALAVLLAIAAIGAALYLRARAAPEPARLLPEAEAILYINFHHLRAASHFGQTPVTHEAEYEDFVRQTGFEFERDLDEAAVAVHPAELTSNHGVPELDHRFSEVFTGHYDATKLAAYLKQLSISVERYDDRDVYLIPHEGRSVRVALLGPDIVAVSNTASPDAIHGILERYRHQASPFSGSDLLRQYFHRVPLGASAWAILKMQSPKGESTLPLPGGVGFGLPNGTVTVASVRFFDPLKLRQFAQLDMASLKNVELRVEAFTPSDADAQKLTNTAGTFLELFRSVSNTAGPRGPDDDVKAFFDSITIRQQQQRAILSAELHPEFLHKLLSDADIKAGAGAAAPEPTPPPQDSAKPAKPAQKNKAHANSR